MKPVLFIAYFFPPLGGSGVQRSLKFVKYLPRFDWNPTVLTQTGSGYIRDETMLAEIPPSIQIRRAFSVETSNLIAPLAALGVRKSEGAPTHRPAASEEASTPSRLYTALSGAKRLLQETVLIPDANIGWLPMAYTQGAKLLEIGEYQAIFSTASPYSAHLIAAMLKRRFKLPWVADFRDEWTLNPVVANIIRRRKPIDQALERWVLRSADAVVTVSDEITDRFADLAPDTPRSKYHTVYNGYDSEDFPAEPPPPPSNRRLRLSHVGSFYLNIQPTELFEALRLLRERRPGIEEMLEVSLVGRMDALQDREGIRAEFGGMLQMTGRVSHDRAVAEMIASDALFLTIPAEFGKRALAGKVFEYLASRRPIIAVVPEESSADRILRKTRGGTVIPNHRPDLLADAIEALLDAHGRTGRIPAQPSQNIEQFSRQALTGALVDVLESVRT